MTAELYRVTYVNSLDGERHVLIGALDKATAERVYARATDWRGDMFMGGRSANDPSRVILEPCDGTPDGAVIK